MITGLSRLTWALRHERKWKLTLIALAAALASCQEKAMTTETRKKAEGSLSTSGKPMDGQLVHMATMLVVANINDSVAFGYLIEVEEP